MKSGVSIVNSFSNGDNLILFYDFEFTRMHQQTTPMSLGMVSYDGLHEFYAEFNDYDQSQVDDWLMKNVLDKFIMSEMNDRSFYKKGNSFFYKGETDWVVNHQYGLKSWLKSFETKIIPAAAGCDYDLVLLKSLLKLKYKEDYPDYFDGWGIDVISLFRWEGYSPGDDNFKEDFIQHQNRADRHNALFDAQVIREMYLKLEDLRGNRPA